MKVTRVAPGLLLFLVILVAENAKSANAEQVRWRYPGLNGLWLDPHNWMGQSSGVPHVPGPTDDVVLSDFSFEYGAFYTVILEVFLFLFNYCGILRHLTYCYVALTTVSGSYCDQQPCSE